MDDITATNTDYKSVALIDSLADSAMKGGFLMTLNDHIQPKLQHNPRNQVFEVTVKGTK
jgi:hypothetical protein